MAALQQLQQRILSADPDLAVTVAPAPDRGGPLQQLPADTRVFIGRARQLEELIASARHGADAAVVYVIDGLAGIGKSALAIHAAHRLRDRFPGGQIFLDLHGHTTGLAPLPAYDALSWLLRCLGVPVQLVPADLGQRAALFRDRLADTKTLLVLDNAFSADQVRPLLPGAPGSMVLITSRKRLAGLDDAYPIALDGLPEDEAIALLRDVAGPARVPPRHASPGELAALCGCMPLALRIAAARLRHQPALRIEDLVERLRDENTRLDHLQDGDRNLAAVFDSSYAALPEAERRMLRGLGLVPGPDFDAYTAANLAGTGLGTAQRLLDSLADHTLLTLHAAGRYRFHDLVRVYARSLSAEDPETERNAAFGRLLDYYQQTARACDRHVARRPRTDPTPARAASAITPEIRDQTGALAWLRAERDGVLAAISVCAEQGDSARVVPLTAALAGFLDRDGSWREVARLHEAAATAARKLGDHPGEADARLNLSRAYEVAGDYAAATGQCELALAIYAELGDRLGEANALHAHGRLLQLTNEYPAAAIAQQRALSAYRQLGNSLGEANALSELGKLGLLTSDAAAAASFASGALAVYRQLGNRLGEANALWDLARARQLAGTGQDGADLMADALVIYQELGYRIGAAKASCTLGTFRSEAGDYVGAIDLIERSLAIYREIGSPLGEAAACRELANVRLMTGDLDRAADLLDRALVLFRALGNRVGQADSLHDLGRTRLAGADHQAAAALLSRALELFGELGVTQGEAEVLITTGALTALTTGPRAAADFYRRAASLAKDIDVGLLEAEALEGAARCAADYGDRPAAVAGLREAVAIYRRIGSGQADQASAFLDALQGPGAIAPVAR